MTGSIYGPRLGIGRRRSSGGARGGKGGKIKCRREQSRAVFSLKGRDSSTVPCVHAPLKKAADASSTHFTPTCTPQRAAQSGAGRTLKMIGLDVTGIADLFSTLPPQRRRPKVQHLEGFTGAEREAEKLEMGLFSKPRGTNTVS